MESSDDTASMSGAKFEENKAPQKIEVKVRPRATRPTDTGSGAAEEISSKPEDPDHKPGLSAPPKASTLKPDITAEEAKPEEVEETEEAKTDDDKPGDDGAAIDELAKVATDKKADKDSDKDSATDSKVQAMIDNKTYYVPIGQVSKRRNTKIFVAILVVVVAACLGAYFMMIG